MSNSNYYTDNELQTLKFGKIGKNTNISKKTSFYGTKNIHIGDNCRIDDFCILSCGSEEGFFIGNYVHIASSVSISGKGKITIGDFAGLSAKVSVFSSTDDYSGEFMTNPCVGSFNSDYTNVFSNDVYIGKHVIIGCNSVILPNTFLTDGVSIGAMSFVNSKIDIIGIYQGNPLRFIKKKSLGFLEIEKQMTGSNLEEKSNIQIDINGSIKNKDINKLFNDFGIIISEEQYHLTLTEIGLDSISQIRFRNNFYKLFNLNIDHNEKIINLIDIINKNEKPIINSKIVVSKEDEYIKINTPLPSVDNKYVSILGLGSCLPSNKIDNTFYTNIMDTSDDWIKKRTGMNFKYLLDNDEKLETIIKTACENAIKNAKIQTKDIDLVILASSSQEDLFGDASRIANLIGAKNAFAFDIKNACNGFTTAIITAEQYIKSGDYHLILVIGADCLSRWVNWNDKKTAILFGDGAGAVIIGKSKNGIMGHIFKTDGSQNHILNINTNEVISSINGIDVINNCYDQVSMDGIEVFKFVTHHLPIYINELLKNQNVSINDIDYFVFHQANFRILEEISIKLDIPKNKILSNIDEVGNTSAASIPILLNKYHNEIGLFKKGDLILMGGFGAGMSLGLILLKWDMEQNLNKISVKQENFEKIALITGGTKGIGLSIAKKLSKEGFRTIVISRNNDILLPDDLIYRKADICSIEDCKNVQKFICETYGKLDLLVNNAGWEGPREYLINMSLESIHKMVNTNILGHLNIIHFMSELLKKARGTIINISSIAAYTNIQNSCKMTLYSLTKSAICTLTRGLCGELKNICKVYSINPTFVDTELTKRMADDLHIDENQLNKLGMVSNDDKLIEPNEIAFFIFLLINGKTRYSSGDEIIILSNLRTTYAKYMYEHIDNRESHFKINITDFEQYFLDGTNVCIFQGQGIKFIRNINDSIYKDIILKNGMDIKMKEICKMFIYEFVELYDENNTHHQQLMIYLISICEFEIHNKTNIDWFDRVDRMAGYSIGEIVALVCSGFISFEDGLKIVNLRGYEMQKINQKINAKMVTIIGINDDDITEILPENVYITNDFSKNIKVIGGLTSDVDNFLIQIKTLYNNIKIKELPINGAYHTNYYQEVGIKLKELLKDITIRKTKIKVYSNFCGIEYNEENFKNLLSSQVYNKVDWYKIVKILKEQPIHQLNEFGPSLNYLTF